MERHWNVIKFTCGLMVDSSLLIERICKELAVVITSLTCPPHQETMSATTKAGQYTVSPHQDEVVQVCAYREYLADLHREKSTNSVDPYNNREICCINKENSVLHCNSKLNYFTELAGEIEHMPSPEQNVGQNREQNQGPPCSVVIQEERSATFLEKVLAALLNIKQPIKFPCIDTQKEFPKIEVELPDFSSPMGMIGAMLGGGFGRMKKPKVIAKEPQIKFYDLEAVAIFNNCNFKEKGLKMVVESFSDSNSFTMVRMFNCNDIPEPMLESLPRNKQLKHLTFSNCRLKFGLHMDKLCAQIKHLPHLEHIQLMQMFGMDISISKGAPPIVEALAPLKSLKTVSLFLCFVSTETSTRLLTEFADCPIERLNLSFNRLGNSINCVAKDASLKFPYLEKLRLDHSEVNKYDILALAEMIDDSKQPNLKFISIGGNRLIEEQDALEKLVLAQRRAYQGRGCSIVVDNKDISVKLSEKIGHKS